MAPFKPRHTSAGSDKIISFGGLLETEFLEPIPGRSFQFRQTYYQVNRYSEYDSGTQRLLASGIKPDGPPLHLHRYQTEFFKVERGVMGVNLDGQIVVKTPRDPEFSVPANSFHGFFRHPDCEGPMTVVLSATDSGRDYKLDRVFFENWYGFWHDSLLHDGKMDYIALVQLYDAGDAYLHVPKWVPFRTTIAHLWGIVIGRWLGALLGHQPFHKEYTTDWDYAVQKMAALAPRSLNPHRKKRT